jgi:hypothetical protein
MINTIKSIVTVVEGLQSDATEHVIQLQQAKLRYMDEASKAEVLLNAIETNQKVTRRMLDSLNRLIERLAAGEEIDPADWWKTGGD